MSRKEGSEQMPRRRNEAFERRYIAEYMLAKFPQGGYTLGQPLGPIPEGLIREVGLEEAARRWRPWRQEVDAARFSPTGVILIEAKVFKWFDGASKLRSYGDLFRESPDLMPWRDLPLQLRLVMPIVPDNAPGVLRAMGLELDVYVTEHVLAHAQLYQRYWTADYQREKQLEEKRLAELGIR